MENCATIHERIMTLVRVFGNGKNTEFAKLIGVSEANIRGYAKDILPKADFLEKIVRSCEGISAEWLLTGEGEMLRGGNVQVSGSGNAVVGNSHNSTATVNATPTDTSDLRAMVEEQRTIIEGLQGQLQEKDKQIAQLLAIISNK